MELPLSTILLIAVCAIAYVAIRLLQKAESNVKHEYLMHPALMSPAERSFYGVLSNVIDDSTIIFSKVRVADVITPRKGLNRKNWQSAFNRISRKHFDFLLCERDNLSVICAIELDDRSHNNPQRKKRDEFLVSACESAGLALLQIPAKRSYVKDDISSLLATVLDERGIPALNG